MARARARCSSCCPASPRRPRARLRIRGRLVALIELGSGFHPELTGRENVYLSGAILGMRRREVDREARLHRGLRGDPGVHRRAGQVVLVRDVRPPRVRDCRPPRNGHPPGGRGAGRRRAAFQAKCFARDGGVEAGGTTILLISHDLAAVERLCPRAVLLDHGRAVFVGSAQEVVAAYERVVEGTPVETAVRHEGPQDVGDSCPSGCSTETQARPRGSPPARLPSFALSTPRNGTSRRRGSTCSSTGSTTGPCTATAWGRGRTACRQAGVMADFEIPVLGLQPGVYTSASRSPRGREQALRVELRPGDALRPPRPGPAGPLLHAARLPPPAARGRPPSGGSGDAARLREPEPEASRRE